MEENVEAVHHVGRAGVIEDVVQVTQQEVEPVLSPRLRGERRVVGVTEAWLVGPQVQQDGAPEVIRGRHIVLALRARPLSPAPGGAVTPEVRLPLVIDGEVLVSPGEAVVQVALTAGLVLIVDVWKAAGFARVGASLRGGAGETPVGHLGVSHEVEELVSAPGVLVEVLHQEVSLHIDSVSALKFIKYVLLTNRH